MQLDHLQMQNIQNSLIQLTFELTSIEILYPDLAYIRPLLNDLLHILVLEA